MLGYGPGGDLPAAADQDGLTDPVPEELPLDPSSFWGEEESLDDLLGEVRLPVVNATLPQRLGGFPFWRGKAPFLETLEPLYLKAALVGLDIFAGLGKMPATESPPTV